MNEAEARERLTYSPWQFDGVTDSPGYESWLPNDKEMVLDGHYTVEDLEAIVWWLKNKSHLLLS